VARRTMFFAVEGRDEEAWWPIRQRRRIRLSSARLVVTRVRMTGTRSYSQLHGLHE
jgi:hypothetical protein